MNTVALIQEDLCIGCTKCLAVCPTDAIVGAYHFMHTVIADDCIGCGLCLPPCPTDCIQMVPFESRQPTEQRKTRLKKLTSARKVRLEEKAQQQLQQFQQQKAQGHDAIQAILARKLK